MSVRSEGLAPASKIARARTNLSHVLGLVEMADCINKRMTYTESRQAFRDMCGAWPRAHAKLIELAASGHPMVDELSRDPELRARLRYRPSTSIYRIAGRLRYAAARLDGKERSYHLVSVEPTPYLDATLARAAVRGGAPHI